MKFYSRSAMGLCQNLAIVSLFMFPCFVCAQADTESMIRNMSLEYIAAFNSRDAEKLSKCWSEKAVYTLPDTNEKLVGRSAIKQMFVEKFSGNDNDQLSLSIQEVRSITDSVAVESGVAKISREGKTIEHSKYSAIHVKEGDQWLLDSVTDIDVVLDNEPASPLAELEWLIGKWIDSSEESTVELDCSWTKNQKFITRNFKVVVAGTEQLEGTQIIGWDPVQQSYRSWVFDSEGGFSQGNWTKQGTNWIVESVGFMADGSPTVSIQVFAPIDLNSFQWQSFGRRVGEIPLPNIDVVTVKRKP